MEALQASFSHMTSVAATLNNADQGTDGDGDEDREELVKDLVCSVLQYEQHVKQLMAREYPILNLNQADLAKLQKRVLANCNVECMWTGSRAPRAGTKRQKIGSKNRPRVSVQIAGKQAKFNATHVMLVTKGEVPMFPGMDASHYCHCSACMVHLVWDLRTDNQTVRKNCFQQRQCVCGLEPGCQFNLHPQSDLDE